MSTQPTLSILQYNVRKSYGQVMAPLFADEPTITKIDIIAIQEPWRNTFQNTTHHPRKDLFELVYLDHPKTRVCFFISKKLQLGSWSTIFHSPNLATLRIQTTCDRIIHIHNIYNPVTATGTNQIPLLNLALAANPNDEHIVMGDFNLHHPAWGGPLVQADPSSEELLILTETPRLNLLLPPGTITYEEGNGRSTIDLIYSTALLSNSVIKCDLSEIDHRSDHFPITTTFQIALLANPDSSPRKNWKKTNLECLLKTLSTDIATSPDLTPRTPNQFNNSKTGLESQIATKSEALLKP